MRLHHVAIRVAEPERSARFYRDLLGLEEISRKDHAGALHAIWLRTGDAVLMLERELRGTGAESGSGHLLALEVEALAPWEERLASADVPVTDRTDSTIFCRDPDGHRVGLSVYRMA